MTHQVKHVQFRHLLHRLDAAIGRFLTLSSYPYLDSTGR